MKNLKTKDNSSDEVGVVLKKHISTDISLDNFDNFLRSQWVIEVAKYPFLTKGQIRQRITSMWRKKNSTQSKKCKTSEEKRKVTFNKKLYIRYRTTSEESSNSTFKEDKYQQNKNSRNYLINPKKNKFQKNKENFDLLLNNNCSWSYKSQITNKKMEGNTESLNVQSTYIKSIPQSKKGRRKSDTLLENHDRNCPDIFKNTDEEINKEGNLILNNTDGPQINGYNRKDKNNEDKLMCEKTDGLVSLESQSNCDNMKKTHVKTILNGSAMSPASSTDEEIFQTRFLVQNESLVHENEYFSDTSHTSSKKNPDKDNVEENDSHTKRKSPIIIQAIACGENKFGVAVLNNLLPSTINEKEINYCQEVIGTVKQSDSSLNVELRNSNFDADSHYISNSNYNENELLDIGNIKSVTKTLSKEKAKCLTKKDESDCTNLHFDRSNDKLNDSVVDDFFSGTLDVNSYQGVKSLRNRKTTPLSEKKTNKSSNKERKKAFENKKLLDISNVKNVTKTFPQEKSKSTATKNVSRWSDSHLDKLSDNLDFISKDFLNDTFGANSNQAVKSPINMKTTPLSREKTKNKSFNKEQKNIFDDKNDSKEKYDLCNINKEKLTNGEKDFFESSHTTESRNVKRKNSRESQTRETKKAKRIQIKQNTDDADKKIEISRKFTFEANANNVKNELYQNDKHSALNKGTRKNASMIKTNNIGKRYKEKMCNEISTNSNIDKYKRHRRNSSRIASEKIKHIEELEQFGTDEEINLDSDNSTKSDTNDISIHKNNDTKLKDSSANTKYTYKNNLKSNFFWNKNVLEDISSDKVQSCSANKDKMNSCNKNIVKSLKNTFDKCSKRAKSYDEDTSNEISVTSNIDKNKRHRRNSSRIASEKIKQIEELEQFDTCEEIDLDYDNGTKSETNDIDIYTNIDATLKDSSAETKYTYEIKNNQKSNSFWNKNVSEDISFDKARSCSDNKNKMYNCHKKIVKSLNKTFDKCSKRDKSYDEVISNEISVNSNIDKNKRRRRNSSRIASEKIKQLEELEQFDTCEEIDLDSDNGTKSETNDIDIYTNIDTILKDSSAETKYTYEIKNNKKSNSFWNKDVSEDISFDKARSCSDNKDKMNNCDKKVVKSLNKTFDKCSKRDKSYDEDISYEISVNGNMDKYKRRRQNSSRITSEKIKQIEELEQFEAYEEIDLGSDNGTKSERNIDIYTNIDTILKDSSAETKHTYEIKNNKKSNSFWNKNVPEDISFDKARSCSDNKDKMNNCHKKVVKSLNKTFEKCSKRDKSYDEDISYEISVNGNMDNYKRHRQNSSRIASEKIKQMEELEQFEAYEEIDLGSDNGTKSERNIDIYTNIDTIVKDSSAETKHTYEIKNNLKSNSFWNKNVSEDISSDKARSCSDNKDKMNNCYKRTVTSPNKTFDKCSKRDKGYDEDINNEMNKTDRGCIKKDQTVKNMRLIFNKKKLQEDTTENKAIIPFNKTLSQTAKKTWDMLEKELLGESEDIYTAKNVNRNAIPETEKTRNQNLRNAERLSLASTAAIQRPMNIVERTIAAMGRCTATLFDTKQRINENEKEDSSLFEEVFDNPDISQETQFHSEITFVAKNNKHYYKNEIFGFVKKSTRRKNTNSVSENHKNSIYSTCTNNTRNKNNKYIEPSKFEESNSEYCTTKNNSKEKSNTIQAVVLSHPIKQVNPWDRLMNNLQLENDNMQKDFSSNNWKQDSFEPVYNKHLSKYSNHSDEEVANNCDEVNATDLENNNEEWKLKDFQTLSDAEPELAENHLTASRNSTLNANNFVHTDSEGDTDASTSNINYRRGNIKNQCEKVQSQKEELNKVNKLKKSLQINITDDAEGLKLKEIPSNSCTTNHSKKLVQLKEKNEIELSQLKQKNAMEFAQSKQNHEINSNDKTKNKREKYKEYLRKRLNRTQLSHRMKDSHKNLIPMTMENKSNGGISENKLENKRNVKRKLIAENDEDVFSVSSSDSEDDKVRSQCTGIFSELFDK